MQLFLEVTAGPHQGKKFVVRAGQQVTFGRTERADYPFALDGQMSSLHYAVRSTPEGFEISDLGSTNGTLLNGQTVAAALLADGDEIRAGQTCFKARVEGAAAGATVPLLASTRAALSSLSPPTVSLSEGVCDPDLKVRREALLAAAWTGQSWLLAHCRKLADRPTPENWDALLLLAVLGKPVELARIEAMSRAEALGPRRMLLCGAFGHPALVDRLLEVMSGPAASLAAVAAIAFTKITGEDISLRQPVEVALDGDGPSSDLPLPDAAKARTHWNEAQTSLAASTRVCRGFDLSDRIRDDVFSVLDMESRWEARLRGRFYGTWQGSVKSADGLG